MRPQRKERALCWSCVLLMVAMSATGCKMFESLLGHHAPAMQWPTSEELAALQPLSNDVNDELNGQAALAAAGAIQETLRLWSDQHLFEGCTTPAQGLGAVVYSWKNGYYVRVTQRFDRCGGKRFRMLDWWESFAVSPEGQVVARQPQEF